MQKILLLLFCFHLSGFCFSQTDSSLYAPIETRYYFDWGNNKTSVLLSQYGSRNDIVLIHLHDDENASLEAAHKVLEQSGGLLIQLENNGKRLMTFKKSGRVFLFDPNRIFTTKGIQKNLHFLNRHVTSASISSLKAFAAFILNKIPGSVTTFIALHNNDNGKYSIKSYRGVRWRDALKVHINLKNDPDNFFIVTRNTMFQKMRKAGFNAVLQNTVKATDDGSLSIFLGRKRRPYINVEAQHGSTGEQTKMLGFLLNNL